MRPGIERSARMGVRRVQMLEMMVTSNKRYLPPIISATGPPHTMVRIMP